MGIGEIRIDGQRPAKIREKSPFIRAAVSTSGFVAISVSAVSVADERSIASGSYKRNPTPSDNVGLRTWCQKSGGT